MKLPQETKTCGANIFEILPFKDDDVKTFAHNILNCDHDEDMNDDSSPVEGGITHLCDKVDSIIRYMKDLGELRLNPCICRYLCEISGFRVRKGQDFGEEVKNFTLVMTDLICCRLRDHAGIDHEEILNISNLPKNLVKGLQTISTVSFHAILAGDIEMRGTWMNNEDNSDIIVEVYSHQILLSTLKALGLFKLYKDPYGGIVLEPEHLVVQEYLAGSHMANMDLEKMRENFLKIPLDRRVMLCKFTAGLQANNKLVQSFMKLLHGDWQTKGSSSVIFPMILSLPDEEVPKVPDEEFMDINIDAQSNASFLPRLLSRKKTTLFPKRKHSFLSALVKESEHRISWSLMSDFLSKNVSSTVTADLKLSISCDPQVAPDSSQVHEVVYTAAPFKSTVQQHIASLTWMENNISDVTYKYKPKNLNAENKFLMDFHTLVEGGNRQMSDQEIDNFYTNFMKKPEDKIPLTAENRFENISIIDASENKELFLSARRQSLMAVLTRGSGKKLSTKVLQKCFKNEENQEQDKFKVYVSFNETAGSPTCHIKVGKEIETAIVGTANEYKKICNIVSAVESLANWFEEVLDISRASYSVDTKLGFKGAIPATLLAKFATIIAVTKSLDILEINVPHAIWQSLHKYFVDMKNNHHLFLNLQKYFIEIEESSLDMLISEIPEYYIHEKKYLDVWFVNHLNGDHVFLSSRRQNLLTSLTRIVGKKLPSNALKFLKNNQIQNQTKYNTYVSFDEASHVCNITIGRKGKSTIVKTADEYSEICNTVGLVEWMKETMDVSHISFSVDVLRCFGTIPANLATKFAVVAANTKDLEMYDTKVAGDVWRSMANVPAQSGGIGRERVVLDRVEMGNQLDAAADYLAGVKRVKLINTKVTSPLLRALTSSIKTRRQNAEHVMEEVGLGSVDLSGVEENAVAEFLSSVKQVTLFNTTVTSPLLRALTSSIKTRRQNEEHVMEEVGLHRMDLSGAEADAVAEFLSSVKRVQLHNTKVTSPLLRALTSSIKTRRQNAEHVMEEVQLENVDLSGAEADAVAEFLSSVKCVELWGTKVTSPLLRALTSSIKTRRQNEEHVVEEVGLNYVDLSGAEADAVAEFITNIKSMKLTYSTRLSTEQWESTARLQERKAIAGESVLEKLVTEESNEFVDRIKMKIL